MLFRRLGFLAGAYQPETLRQTGVCEKSYSSGDLEVFEDVMVATTNSTTTSTTTIYIDSYTKSLLHCNGADGGTTFTDEKGKTWSRMNFGVETDTAQKVFGTASLYFHDAGWGDGWLASDEYSDWVPGAGDFTVEFRVRFESISSALGNPTAALFGSDRNDGGGNPQLMLDYDNGALKLYLGSGVPKSFAWSPSLNTWYGIMVERDGTNVRVFVDGVQIGATESNSYNIAGFGGTMAIHLGHDWEAWASGLNGWIDEFRFSKGVARETSNYSLATEEFSY